MLSQTKLNQTKWIFSHQLINQTKCIWFALLTDRHYIVEYHYCIFMDIFKSEHRKLHELRITIDTLTDSLRDCQERRKKGKV